MMDAEIKEEVQKEYWSEQVVEAYKWFLLPVGKNIPIYQRTIKRRNFWES